MGFMENPCFLGTFFELLLVGYWVSVIARFIGCQLLGVKKKKVSLHQGNMSPRPRNLVCVFLGQGGHFLIFFGFFTNGLHRKHTFFFDTFFCESNVNPTECESKLIL